MRRSSHRRPSAPETIDNDDSFDESADFSEPLLQNFVVNAALALADDMFWGSEGLDQTNVRGNTYEAVKDPSNVEAVIARFEPGGPLYKFARYYSASLIGEFPGASRDDDDDSAPDEFELYNLDADPFEQNNLAGKRSARNVQNALNALLLELRQERAVTPQNRNISQ